MLHPARLVALIALSGAVAVGMAACGGPPAGVDGDLTGDWHGLPQPVGFVPDYPACHDQPYRQVAPLTDYAPVACDGPHLVETFHVGDFSGDAADLAEPPTADSSEHRAAYAQCEEQATDFLGADFRQGRLWLGVTMPSAAGWDGGARWFRCELVEVATVYGEPVSRDSSLAGALDADDGEPGLRLGCYQVEVDDDGQVTDMTQSDCSDPHQAEYVGSWRASGGGYPDPEESDAEDRVYEGCREQIAEYVDLPVDGDLVFRTGAIADWMSESDWRAGDRAFRCYLWLPGSELTESLAGAGTGALPVQTE